MTINSRLSTQKKNNGTAPLNSELFVNTLNQSDSRKHRQIVLKTSANLPRGISCCVLSLSHPRSYYIQSSSYHRLHIVFIIPSSSYHLHHTIFFAPLSPYHLLHSISFVLFSFYHLLRTFKMGSNIYPL